MLGIDLDTVRNGSLFTVAGAVLLALAAVWLVKQVVTKVLTVAILLAIAGLVYSQRTELNDCVDSARVTIAAGLVDDTECTFFGQSVKIPGRDTLFDDDSASPSSTTSSVPGAG
ncbi:hypothetical protein [Desertimonas flava]|jgi:hypothetical protein|uniref:hypothetical protein n=1 Tax=Desertimonas flava TaxID=2064846 RepID=UPI000E34757C|nr:hypothetical protein [Desertimonas flava]